jgi:mRNA interferase RelE/StbE
LSRSARADLQAVKDKRSYQAVKRKLLELQDEPATRGKPLSEGLKGYYSVRAAGQRYRIVYSVKRDKLTVTVLVIGIRKEGDKRDVYRVAQKRLEE